MTRIAKETAEAYLAAGLGCLPAAKTRKHPSVGSWKTWQKRLPTQIEVTAWFSNEHDGICCIAGKVSGNLECLDFDNHGELFSAWAGKIDTELLSSLVIEQTPSSGYHVLYRCDEPVDGNLKLARGIRDGKQATLIETRGEGGLFLCAPTEGYSLKQGELTSVATISADARNSLLEAARSLDELPAANTASAPNGAAVGVPGATVWGSGTKDAFELSPGDDFNARGDIRQLLTDAGWTHLFTEENGNEHWQRPGKTDKGTSATFKDGNFHVFSSNAYPFEVGDNNLFAVYAKIRHNGNFTAATADLLSQGYGKTKDPTQSVTFSLGLPTAQAVEDDEPDDDAQCKDPGPMPEEFYDVPGFISELMKHTLKTAPYPNKPLAFAGAFAMTAHLAGRKFRDEFNTRPNVYVLSLAASGSGKQHPRSVNVSLASQCGFARELGDYFASGEGLEDAMMMTPSMLFQMDEADALFNTVKMEDSRAEMLNSMLLRFFSESSSGHVMRKRALARGQSIGDASSCISQPHLTLLGTAVPQFLYAALSERVMANGLLARCIVLEANSRGQMNECPKDNGFSQELKEMVETIRRRGERIDLVNDVIEPEVVPMDEDAKLLRLAMCREADLRYSEVEKTNSEAAKSLWARVGEKAQKAALIYAISENPQLPRINKEALEWAKKFIFHATMRMLFQAGVYVYESEFDKQAKKIRRKLLSRPEYSISHRRLLQDMHMGKDEMKKLIDTMVERGEIENVFGPKGGLMYRLKK